MQEAAAVVVVRIASALAPPFSSMISSVARFRRDCFVILAQASEFHESVHTEPDEMHVMQGLPTNLKNRPTNRARCPRNFYTPYKPSYEPCTASEEFLQTVQTVLQTVHGIQGIPTNRTNRSSGGEISTTQS